MICKFFTASKGARKLKPESTLPPGPTCHPCTSPRRRRADAGEKRREHQGPASRGSAAILGHCRRQARRPVLPAHASRRSCGSRALHKAAPRVDDRRRKLQRQIPRGARAAPRWSNKMSSERRTSPTRAGLSGGALIPALLPLTGTLCGRFRAPTSPPPCTRARPRPRVRPPPAAAAAPAIACAKWRSPYGARTWPPTKDFAFSDGDLVPR